MCQLDPSFRFSRRVALTNQPIHKVPHLLPTAVSLLLPLGTVTTTFLTIEEKSRLASTDAELLHYAKVPSGIATSVVTDRLC